MKTKFSHVLTALVIALIALPFLAHVAYAYQGEVPPVVVSGEQAIIIGLVASVLTTALKWISQLYTKQGLEYPPLVGESIVLVVSSLLAWWWFPFVFPAWPVVTGDAGTIVKNIFDWLGTLVSVLGGWFLTAHYFYKLVMEKIQAAGSARILGTPTVRTHRIK